MECENCGKSCQMKPSMVKQFRFCSRECMGAWTSAHHPRVSSLEVAVAEELTRRGIAYEAQVRLGRFTVDFLIGSTVLEVDGVYWHSLPKVVARDRRKDRWLQDHGYLVVRITEAEVRSEDFAALAGAS